MPEFRTRRGEAGTTLLLFPAAMLVLVLLSAIAVDLSRLHLARRELVQTAGQAADDAAGALEQRALRERGEIRIDPERAAQIVRFELEAASLPGPIVAGPRTEVSDDGQEIDVSVSIAVAPLFGRTVRGADASDIVDITVSSRLLATP